MSEPDVNRRDLLQEIINKKMLGDKKFHSESSLQRFNEEEDSDPNKDPGVSSCIKNTFVK